MKRHRALRVLGALLAVALVSHQAQAWESQTTHAGLAEQAALASRLHKRLVSLGFQGGPVVVSVMAESLLLALIGGLVGGGLAWAIADGYQTATMNWQSFSQVAFSLTVTPRLLAGGIAYALAMGFLGGIFPAVGAARTPIVVGLRQV